MSLAAAAASPFVVDGAPAPQPHNQLRLRWSGGRAAAVMYDPAVAIAASPSSSCRSPVPCLFAAPYDGAAPPPQNRPQLLMAVGYVTAVIVEMIAAGAAVTAASALYGDLSLIHI